MTNNVSVLDFLSFLFRFVCLCVSQSLSVRLFKINLKFLKTCNYWLVQLMYVSLVSGLELKACRFISKCLRILSKIHGRALVSGFRTKQRLQQLKFLLFLWLLCQWLCDKIGSKILLMNQNHFSGFCFFKKN